MIVAKRLLFHHDPASGQSAVVNGVTGAIDLLPINAARMLERERAREPSTDLMEMFGHDMQRYEERGYLVASLDAEDQALRALEARYQALRTRRTTFMICPTYACNLACVYCYEGDLTSHGEVMTPEKLDRVLEVTDALRSQVGGDARMFQYELYGGEPLLPNTRMIVQGLLAGLESRGGLLSIITNGTNLIDYLPLLRQFRPVVECVQVTIDGPPEVHDQRRLTRDGRGSFDRISRGVDALLADGFEVRVRVNVDKKNLARIPELLDHMERREWTLYQHFVFDIAPVMRRNTGMTYDEITPEEEIVRRLLEECPEVLRGVGDTSLGVFRVLSHLTSVLEPQRARFRVAPKFTYCEATAGTVYVFGPDGTIYGCPDAVVNRQFAIGEYWPEFRIDPERQSYWRCDIFSRPQCRACEIATFCGGGCALIAFDNELDQPHCNGARETVHAYLASWFRRRPQGPTPVTAQPAA